MSRPRLLDLFCGAGGAGRGYHDAGFDVTGVDIADQPRYPFDFVQADALSFPLDGFDAIHASPPCQAHTTMSNRWRGKGGRADGHPDLIAATRDRLERAGVPWVMENVAGARKSMRNPFILNGGMFDLGVHRPRLFESNVLIFVPASAGRGEGTVGVYGEKPDGRRLVTRPDGSTYHAASSLEEAAAAMGMPWADWHGLTQAIPPAYTRWIGEHLLVHVPARVA